jgi:hypothetical protein
MNIEAIRQRVRAGDYLIKSHAVQHALKEGFERKHIAEAICNGRIIEEYPDDQRVLICGSAIIGNSNLYLHIVCESADPVYAEVVTAYIPDKAQWEIPPFKRRKR